MYLCLYDTFQSNENKMEPVMFNPSWWNGYSSKVAVKKTTDKNMVNKKLEIQSHIFKRLD